MVRRASSQAVQMLVSNKTSLADGDISQLQCKAASLVCKDVVPGQPAVAPRQPLKKRGASRLHNV